MSAARQSEVGARESFDSSTSSTNQIQVKFPPSTRTHLHITLAFSDNAFTEITELLSQIRPMTPATPAIWSEDDELIPSSPRIKFQRCSWTQRRSIAAAARGAQTYASNAYFSARTYPRSARYIRWFGSWNRRRHSLVVSHFQSIRGNRFLDFTYDCSCRNRDWFAYVYGNQYGTIHLCPAFWTIHTVGTDSQAGTLIHEASHFDKNGGTDDIKGAYGLDGARSLARRRPDQAVKNAENHMFFAENAL
ncbi:hypothetical protein D9613_001488 [Agrocybe pediades]|uniref:Lysine-specific metallo-endopeptidase domain-containing protein n=1 Tax=Agrocybe pediades TaxID=84607 RepID=A0A8H4VV21_9AGAR|nr:hypothetical protein D9613_001488 [Agrocybe pediades]